MVLSTLIFRRLLFGALASVSLLVSMWEHLDRTEDKLKSQLSLGGKRQHFDFIIVGGGTAGSVVARRLSAKYHVLLLESGGEPHPYQSIPRLSEKFTRHPQVDWNYKTSSQKKSCLALNHHQSSWSAGRGLGGTSNLDSMIYLRGHPKDYDHWALLSRDPSWSYAKLLRFFKRSEDFRGLAGFSPKVHGMRGPLRVEIPDYVGFSRQWIFGGKELGFGHFDLNGKYKQGFDTVYSPIQWGRRQSTYSAYIDSSKNNIFDVHPNLSIFKYSTVTKILMRGPNHRAYGVVYERHGVKRVAFAKKEIILSAGAIESPKLLMLSGIGPARYLIPLSIPVLQDLPVGQNLQDHVGTLLGPFFVKKGRSFLFDRDISPAALAFSQFSVGKGALTSTGANAIALLTSHHAQHHALQHYFTKRTGEASDDQEEQETPPDHLNAIEHGNQRSDKHTLELEVRPTRSEQTPGNDTATDETYLVPTIVQLPHVVIKKPAYYWTDIQLTLRTESPHRSFPKDIYDKKNVKKGIALGYYKHTRGKDAFFIHAAVTRPYSRGEVRLSSPYPADKPIIDPRYFDNEFDAHLLHEAVKRSIDIAENTTGFAKLHSRLHSKPFPPCQKIEFRSDEYWDCYIRHLTLSLNHPAGTCAMGHPDSAHAVVDSQLRVIGTQSLRVIDASIMPTIVSSSPQGAVIMIAEKGADMILKTWHRHRAKHHHHHHHHRRPLHHSQTTLNLIQGQDKVDVDDQVPAASENSLLSKMRAVLASAMASHGAYENDNSLGNANPGDITTIKDLRGKDNLSNLYQSIQDFVTTRIKDEAEDDQKVRASFYVFSEGEEDKFQNGGRNKNAFGQPLRTEKQPIDSPEEIDESGPRVRPKVRRPSPEEQMYNFLQDPPNELPPFRAMPSLSFHGFEEGENKNHLEGSDEDLLDSKERYNNGNTGNSDFTINKLNEIGGMSEQTFSTDPDHVAAHKAALLAFTSDENQQSNAPKPLPHTIQMIQRPRENSQGIFHPQSPQVHMMPPSHFPSHMMNPAQNMIVPQEMNQQFPQQDLLPQSHFGAQLTNQLLDPQHQMMVEHQMGLHMLPVPQQNTQHLLTQEFSHHNQLPQQEFEQISPDQYSPQEPQQQLPHQQLAPEQPQQYGAPSQQRNPPPQQRQQPQQQLAPRQPPEQYGSPPQQPQQLAPQQQPPQQYGQPPQQLAPQQPQQLAPQQQPQSPPQQYGSPPQQSNPPQQQPQQLTPQQQPQGPPQQYRSPPQAEQGQPQSYSTLPQEPPQPQQLSPQPFGAPAPQQSAPPQPQQLSPQGTPQSYGAPPPQQTQQLAPQPQQLPPQGPPQSYGAPQVPQEPPQSYGSPPPQQPQQLPLQGPPQSYGSPPPQQGPPQSYGAPPPQQQPQQQPQQLAPQHPPEQYGAPNPQHSGPSQPQQLAPQGPAQSYGAPPQNPHQSPQQPQRQQPQGPPSQSGYGSPLQQSPQRQQAPQRPSQQLAPKRQPQQLAPQRQHQQLAPQRQPKQLVPQRQAQRQPQQLAPQRQPPQYFGGSQQGGQRQPTPTPLRQRLVPHQPHSRQPTTPHRHLNQYQYNANFPFTNFKHELPSYTPVDNELRHLQQKYTSQPQHYQQQHPQQQHAQQYNNYNSYPSTSTYFSRPAITTNFASSPFPGFYVNGFSGYNFPSLRQFYATSNGPTKMPQSFRDLYNSGFFDRSEQIKNTLQRMVGNNPRKKKVIMNKIKAIKAMQANLELQNLQTQLQSAAENVQITNAPIKPQMFMDGPMKILNRRPPRVNVIRHRNPRKPLRKPRFKNKRKNTRTRTRTRGRRRGRGPRPRNYKHEEFGVKSDDSEELKNDEDQSESRQQAQVIKLDKPSLKQMVGDIIAKHEAERKAKQDVKIIEEAIKGPEHKKEGIKMSKSTLTPLIGNIAKSAVKEELKKLTSPPIEIPPPSPVLNPPGVPAEPHLIPAPHPHHEMMREMYNPAIPDESVFKFNPLPPSQIFVPAMAQLPFVPPLHQDQFIGSLPPYEVLDSSIEFSQGMQTNSNRKIPHLNVKGEENNSGFFTHPSMMQNPTRFPNYYSLQPVLSKRTGSANTDANTESPNTTTSTDSTDITNSNTNSTSTS